MTIDELVRDGEAQRDQELAVRAEERTALITSIADGIRTLLETAATVAETTDGNTTAFRRAVVPRLQTTVLSSAVLMDARTQPSKRVLAVAGRTPLLVDTFDAQCWRAIRRTRREGRLGIIKADIRNGMRVLGLAAAMRPGSRFVVYGEILVPEAMRYNVGGSSSDGLEFAFYLGSESPKNVLASSTTDLPIRGHRLVRTLNLGGEPSLIVFADPSGGPRFLLPLRLWLVLGTGLVVTTIIALLVEWNRRRRMTAMRLVGHLRKSNVELAASETALRTAEGRYRDLVEELPMITYVDALDDVATSIYLSPQIVDLLGWPVEYWLEDPQRFIDAIHPDDRKRFLELTAEHARGRPFSLEYRLTSRFGRTHWVLDQASIEHDAAGNAVRSRGFLLDITARKEAEEAQEEAQRALMAQAELNRHQALHDSLTGLPNRRLFRDRIEEALEGSSSTDEHVAVALIDLDHFKEVNDTLGHQRGDLLLEGLGERLRALVRRNDTVARLGGDEFGIVACGVTSEDALAMAHGIRDALAAPVSVAGLDLEVGASIGIAVYPQHGSDVEELIRHADVALYRSKEVRLPVVYAAEHDHYSPARLQLLTGLRSAIEGGELALSYQPQVMSETGELSGVEALVRWRHPELGLVMPDQFIPLAEHTDLIRPLTLHVLETALEQCGAWAREEHEVGVAVNVTARDLIDARFPDEVAARLARAAVRPELLTLEITEGAVLTDPVRARGVLMRLAAIGVRVAIDDFGVGYSSLGLLKKLPIHILKIDKSFVLGMATDDDDAAIVRSTIELAHNLGLHVIAEGVESAEVWRLLAALGCDAVQGYHFARPVPADHLFRVGERFPALAPSAQAVSLLSLDADGGVAAADVDPFAGVEVREAV